MSDLWFEAGEFVRRWWKVLLPVVVVAIVIPVALVAAGGDDDGSSEATPASADSLTAPDESLAEEPSSEQKQGAHEQDGGKARKASHDDSQGSGKGTPSDAPATPYGPPGKPVGTVPPGAPLSVQQRAVALTLRNFLRAVSRADGPQACAQLSEEGRKRAEREVHGAAPETEGSPCEGAIVLYQGGWGKSIRNPRITDVQVTGARATAVGPPGHRDAVLTRYDNVWLIDNYGWD